METTRVSKYTLSFGLALSLAAVVNGLLVVAKEKIPAVMAGMQNITGHHWITHSVVVLGLFAICGWLFAKSNGGQGIKMTVSRLLFTLLAGVSAGALIILGFYLVGD